MLRQDPEGRRLRVAPAPVQYLSSLPAPTTLQSHTSNPYPGFFAAPANTAPITLSSTSSLVTTPALPSLSSAPVLTGVSTCHHQKAKTIKKTAKGEKVEKKKKKKKSKNGQAINPFQAKWYTTKKIYSDLTYYHKITVTGLEAFLEDEGIDVKSEFPAKAKYYLVRKDGSLKGLNRGWAIVQKAKMVHQRVINLKKTGPNMQPYCGESEDNDSLLIDKESTGLVSVDIERNDSDNKPVVEAFEGDSADGDFEWDDELVTPTLVPSFRNPTSSPVFGNAFSRGRNQALDADDTGMNTGVLSNQDTSNPRSNGFGRAPGVWKSQKFGRKSKRPLGSDSDSDAENGTYLQSNHQRAARPAKIQKTGLKTNIQSTQPGVFNSFHPKNVARAGGETTHQTNDAQRFVIQYKNTPTNNSPVAAHSANSGRLPENNATTILLPIQPDHWTRNEVNTDCSMTPGNEREMPAAMDILIVLEMFNGLKTIQENCRDEIGRVTFQSVEYDIFAFPADSAMTPAGEHPSAPQLTVNSEGAVLNNAGEVVISIEVQKLVKKIVAAEERYLSNETHQPDAAENNWELEQDSMSYEDYLVPRAALIQRLETDLNWTIDRHHRRQQIIETVEQIWPRSLLGPV